MGLVTVGCGHAEDPASPPALSAADRCTQYVLSMLEQTYRPGTNPDAALEQLTYNHGTNSVESRAYLAALQENFGSMMFSDGMAAALTAIRPTVADVCPTADTS